MQISLAELARICGYGSNPHRLQDLFKAKASSKSVGALVSHQAVAPVSKERKDKVSGDPIWTRAWHHFMSVKKGQSFRCKIVKTERKQDPVSKKWVWNTQWVRHQKRFMSMKMKEFRSKVLLWYPYIEWRESFLVKNPKLPSSWQVGESRLYKEKCFCVDAEEDVRKCGCETHLKMGELVAALKRWRRRTYAAIQRKNIHDCEVWS